VALARVIGLLAGLWLGLFGLAFAQELQPVPALSAHVTDTVGLLPEDRRQALESQLVQLEKDKGAQLAVLIVSTTRPEPIESYSLRVAEAWRRGATEVCMQGGIHPAYTGDTYVDICRTVKAAQPGMHVHAFSPLEVLHGARTTGSDVPAFLRRLREAGLGTLPGTAAEILDDEVRAQICPDKLDTAQWLAVIEAAHREGLRTTATIMFGHVERLQHAARHLLRIRDLQARTGGFTEFVPLPYVHMEAPMHRHGLSRCGPTWREAVLMHAVARLALHPLVPNIQVSWVKMGREGAQACLQAGANDLGGTLMNESISRAAGTVHGQELPPQRMDALIRAAGRIPLQRSTLYAPVPQERCAASYHSDALAPLVLTPLARRRKPTAPSSALETTP